MSHPGSTGPSRRARRRRLGAGQRRRRSSPALREGRWPADRQRASSRAGGRLVRPQSPPGGTGLPSSVNQHDHCPRGARHLEHQQRTYRTAAPHGSLIRVSAACSSAARSRGGPEQAAGDQRFRFWARPRPVGPGGRLAVGGGKTYRSPPCVEVRLYVQMPNQRTMSRSGAERRRQADLMAPRISLADMKSNGRNRRSRLWAERRTVSVA